ELDHHLRVRLMFDAAASKIIGEITLSTAKAIGNKISSRIHVSIESRQLLADYLKQNTSRLSTLTAYRPLPQALDTAYVPPYLLDGDLSRMFSPVYQEELK